MYGLAIHIHILLVNTVVTLLALFHVIFNTILLHLFYEKHLMKKIYLKNALW